MLLENLITQIQVIIFDPKSTYYNIKNNEIYSHHIKITPPPEKAY